MTIAGRQSGPEHLVESLKAIVNTCVTPITAYGDAEPDQQWGTGTFFRVGDCSFLVTAFHVWDSAQRLNRRLRVFDEDRVEGHLTHFAPVNLEGQGHYNREPADVMIIELTQAAVDKLPNRHFLRLNEVSLGVIASEWCWVYGFPSDMTRADNTSLTFGELFLQLPCYCGDPALENYDVESHFLLDATPEDSCRPDGTPTEMPKRLGGISGCSVWQAVPRLGVLSALSVHRDLRIVGVETSYYPTSSLIRATHWGAIAKILYDKKPNLRPSLEMHLGPG